MDLIYSKLNFLGVSIFKPRINNLCPWLLVTTGLYIYDLNNLP